MENILIREVANQFEVVSNGIVIFRVATRALAIAELKSQINIGGKR